MSDGVGVEVAEEVLLLVVDFVAVEEVVCLAVGEGVVNRALLGTGQAEGMPLWALN